ncbi:MAG: glycosyltransferase family 2 protein [Planctomycetota bacterium]|nr:glycosyltransferase family 2 protein [Planctomycetota bacterium]
MRGAGREIAVAAEGKEGMDLQGREAPPDMSAPGFPRGLPPPPGEDAPLDAWRKYAAELEAVIAAGEHRAGFLQRQLNRIIGSPAWKLLKKARSLLSASRPSPPRGEGGASAPDKGATPLLQTAIQGEPLVSILIPFRDGAKMLARCLESVRGKTAYKHYEFVLIDNGSVERSTQRLLTREKSKPNVRAVLMDEPFNFARLNNRGAQEAHGEYLLLLNNDIEVIEPGWLGAMLEQAQRPEVGAVGAKLLYPDGLIQHAGGIVGQDDIAAHAYRLCPADEPEASCVRNCAAVTGACLLTRTRLFGQLGGLNETDLPVAYNDVDYCLRLREKGLLVVYTPHAVLLHHESATRGPANDPREAAYMCRRWARAILGGGGA